MRALLCRNPDAGVGGHTVEQMVDAAKLAGFKVEHCSTNAKNFPACLEHKTELIIAAGGDGTVAKVAKNMPDRSIPLAIFPLGHANDIARSFGISGAPHELAEHWKLDSWRPLHIGLARGDWGENRIVEALGVGVIAELMHAKALHKRSTAAKLDAGRRVLRDILAEAEEIDIAVTIDGAPVPRDSILGVEILNVEYTGPALPFLPPGFLTDGNLGIVIIRRDARESVLTWLKSPAERAIPVHPLQGQTVELEWSGASLRLDDKAIDLADRRHNATVGIDETPVRLLVKPADPVH
jgi:diacylglycerol kinase family enzyme